jgi:hypothetical protein
MVISKLSGACWLAAVGERFVFEDANGAPKRVALSLVV